MKRLIYDFKTASYKFGDWIPETVSSFGDSCVRKQKYVSDTVRINNNEVSTGSTRIALYTMPGGVDNGVRYAPLYESSGLDITEIEANKALLTQAKNKVDEMVKEEFEKTVKETVETSKQSISNSSSDSSAE